jgi:hypothetical protein
MLLFENKKHAERNIVHLCGVVEPKNVMAEKKLEISGVNNIRRKRIIPKGLKLVHVAMY